MVFFKRRHLQRRSKRPRRSRLHFGYQDLNASQRTLADLSSGENAIVLGFYPGLSRKRQILFQAYGLTAGTRFCLLSHQPVYVIQVENIELALEKELAALIIVGDITSDNQAG